MNIDDIRCIAELVVPVLAWLAGIFARGRKSAPGDNQGPVAEAGVVNTDVAANAPAPPVESQTAWSVHFEQPAVAAARMETPGAKTKRPRWLKDFGPGALGAFLVTLGLLAFGYFVDTSLSTEAQQMGLMAELICLPVSLVMGALLGTVGALLAKQVAQALHSGERAQRNAAAISSFLFGAVTGFLCDGLGLMGAYL